MSLPRASESAFTPGSWHTSRERGPDPLDGFAVLRALLEVTPDAIFAKDLDGRYVVVNRAAARFLGRSPEEIIGRHDTELFDEETARQFIQADQQALATGSTQSFEGSAIGEGGTRQDYLVTKSVYRDSDGRILGVFGISHDITGRKAAERALQTNESDYRTLIEAAADGIATLDAAGRIDGINGTACRMLGYTRDEALGLRVKDIVCPEELARVGPALAGIAGGEELRGEWRIRRKDGTEFPADVSATRLPAGRTLGIVRDMTERKRLDASQRVQLAALAAAGDAIVITDRTGAIEWTNPAFTRLTGYTAEEALGRNPRDLMKSGKHPPEFYQDLWETIMAGRTWHGQTINRRKDGSLYTEDQDVTPILDAGAITHFVAIKRDITERLQLEGQFRQAQKMESVGQLASGIAHDFNNLLTIINGMSDLVLLQVDPADQVHADVQEIHRAGERAAGLTRQLLAFSRQQVLEPRVQDLNTVVAGLEDLLGRLLGEDIDFAAVPAPDPCCVKVDVGQIEQVITNLAVNARDAMAHGGHLTIEVEGVALAEGDAREHGAAIPPGPYVMLSVSDSGTGMDEATRARIFEPFFTTKGPGKGTGLGLSTVYGIVKQSHGFIWVYSEVGRGTTFKMYLPRVTETGTVDQPMAGIVSTSGTETILLVEDNPGLRKTATRFLEPAGYTVLEAASGEEALALLDGGDGAVDLLLTDVVMPGMSGRELVERVAKALPGIKVLYMSGYTSDTVLRHGVLDARVPFVNKPFTAATLRQKVREVLNS